MNNTITMNLLKAGQTAKVVKLNTKGSMRRRFMDLGLVENTSIVCLGQSPAGDPKAFLIKGAVIAIREEDSSTVIVKHLRN